MVYANILAKNEVQMPLSRARSSVNSAVESTGGLGATLLALLLPPFFFDGMQWF